MAKLVDALDLGSSREICKSSSLFIRNAYIAQLVEHWTENPFVISSSLILGSYKIFYFINISLFKRIKQTIYIIYLIQMLKLKSYESFLVFSSEIDVKDLNLLSFYYKEKLKR